MDNWEKTFIDWLNNLQKHIEQISQDVDEDINKTLTLINQEIEQWAEDSEDYLEHITDDVNDFLDQTETFITEIIDIFVADEYDENVVFYHDDRSEDNFSRDFEYWFIDDYPQQPDPDKHPACIGCKHYHGQSYGGNLLVCAMHPYGCQEQQCPDWEKS